MRHLTCCCALVAALAPQAACQSASSVDSACKPDALPFQTVCAQLLRAQLGYQGSSWTDAARLCAYAVLLCAGDINRSLQTAQAGGFAAATPMLAALADDPHLVTRSLQAYGASSSSQRLIGPARFCQSCGCMPVATTKACCSSVSAPEEISAVSCCSVQGVTHDSAALQWQTADHPFCCAGSPAMAAAFTHAWRTGDAISALSAWGASLNDSAGIGSRFTVAPPA